jgi:hypothetical protein
MIAVWPSRPGFGEQMAEAVLATALAVPVLFAFAELRGTRLVGTATAPQKTGTLSNSNNTSAAERESSPVRVVLSDGSDTTTSVWDSRLAVLMEAIRLASHDASETSVKSETEPETSDVDRPLEPIAEPAHLNRQAGRPTQPSLSQASETPSESDR